MENLTYHSIPSADGEDEVRQRHAANRLAWNEGAERYSEELAETLAFLREGRSNLHPIERANLGEHVEPYWDNCPNLKAEQRQTIPQTFSLRARRPI